MAGATKKTRTMAKPTRAGQRDRTPKGRGAIAGVVHSDAGEPLAGAIVAVYENGPTAEPLTRTKTDDRGGFSIDLADRRDECDLRIGVISEDGRVLMTPDGTVVHLNGASVGLDLTVPPDALPERQAMRPTVRLGPLRADALIVAEAKPQLALDATRLLLGEKISTDNRKRVALLFPDVGLVERRIEPLCYTSVLEALEALIIRKGWPRDVALSCDAILGNYDSSFAATYNCPNFSISYDTSQVDPDTSAATVYDPGTNPPVAIGSLPAGGPPTYIKRVCFWLERALAAYTSAPFSMLNPAAAGRIPVVINTSPYGSASTSGTFYLNNALNADLMCAVAVHELFHMVQYMYGGPAGTWRQSVFEGGAVFAEDTAADRMNRYLDEAGTNFNGVGVMSNPNLSLDTASYKCSLFWRYISEQQSGDITEPFIGVETYRRVLELCSAGSYSAANVKQAIRELPWYQDFYEFGYLDPARLDRTNSETTLGNYALACRLKDLGLDVPDRRFEFMEDEENIYIDEVIPGAPPQSTLASVTLSGNSTITPSVSAVWSGTVNKYAHRYYEVTIDPAVTNVQVNFSAGAGLTSQIFQIAQIDAGGAVRDIHRTDAATYSKRITSDRAGVKLAKLVLVVTGADSAGTFTLSAAPAPAAPDVMVTRWHSAMKTEYEIDSFGWAWTWVSPDIWVDNDNNGIADSEVFFNYDNKLHIRLHNKGNATASGIGVQFWYQDASPGLSNAGWLPVQNTAAVTQTLSGLTLAAGTSVDFSVDWSPVPSGTSHHFCIRAVVSAPGDPNTDNKRVLSNFGNVRVRFRKFVDLSLVRRNILDRIGPVSTRVIPRLTPDLQIETRDVTRLEALELAPGEETVDMLRLTHRKITAVFEHRHEDLDLGPHAGHLAPAPDPRGHYGADERTLPPGVAGRPMVTVVHELDGMALGGVTYLVTVDGDDRSRRGPASAKAGKSATGKKPRKSGPRKRG
ncbi:MAG: hypothetical protein WCB04_03975 [Mycobacteriales bacterium]